MINVEALEFSPDNKIDEIKYKPQLIGKSKEILEKIYNTNEYYIRGEQGILLMEIAYSFLSILNTATKHAYYGDIYKNVRKYFSNIAPDYGNIQYEWLFKFNEGIAIRKQIIQFYRQFFVFSLNSLISPNEFDTELDDYKYDFNKLVTKAHFGEYGISYFITQEIKSSGNLTMSSKRWKKEDVEQYIYDYFIKCLFRIIYKYIEGVYKTYKFDSYYKELADTIKRIINSINKYTYKGICK